MPSKVKFRWLLVSALLLLFGGSLLFSSNVSSSYLVPQTPFDGSTLPQFEAPLPVFGSGWDAAYPRVDARKHPYLKVKMKEIDQQVLPATMGFGTTKVWAYEIRDSVTGKLLAPAHWPAVTIDAARFKPTTVRYENDLPSFPIGLIQGLITTDQTIHWAAPSTSPGSNPCYENPLGGTDCAKPFSGPVPGVVHLHGAEAPSISDGVPDAWFTPTGLKGPGYFSLDKPGPGVAVNRYPNDQEPGTLLFHDHTLGAKRTNVYSGLLGFYFIRDPDSEPRNLPKGAYEIEMAVQDRQFDTKGQLYFPDGSDPGCGAKVRISAPCLDGPPPNPTINTFWIPEFVGDVVTVNGAPWPFLRVEPRRYRFRFANGSNSRMYDMTFGSASAGETLPPVYVIGSDDNYLDSPQKVGKVFMATGERYDVIVDFTGLAGKTVTVINDAPVPYPSGRSPVPARGAPADQPQMSKIMQFQVSVPIKGRDDSCNPAEGKCKRPARMVRLADGNGNVVKELKIDKVRQLTLKERKGAGPPGGMVEVMLNNTKWDGQRSPGIAAIFQKDGVSELPRQGSVEMWEIINLTMEAHPIHTHLTQFQVVNRHEFTGNHMTLSGGYYDAWGAAFGYPNNLPAGCKDPTNAQNPCPAYGPPLPYTTPNAEGAIGGNPAVGPYLTGTPIPPDPAESGWKDVARAYPGQVLRLLVRWTPSYVPQIRNKSYAGKNLYSFDPTAGPGYVWHCHIIDHEDNEMMRPYKVTK